MVTSSCTNYFILFGQGSQVLSGHLIKRNFFSDIPYKEKKKAKTFFLLASHNRKIVLESSG